MVLGRLASEDMQYERDILSVQILCHKGLERMKIISIRILKLNFLVNCLKLTVYENFYYLKLFSHIKTNGR